MASLPPGMVCLTGGNLFSGTPPPPRGFTIGTHTENIKVALDLNFQNPLIFVGHIPINITEDGVCPSRDGLSVTGGNLFSGTH